MITSEKNRIFEQLQQDVLNLQGFKQVGNTTLDVGLGAIKNAFPNTSFPLGCMHEFLSERMEDTASSSGFMAGLLASLMGSYGTVIWISSFRKLFPAALKNFGIEPDHFIFIDPQKEKDVLWAMDEALKCGALTAVVGEMREISFTNSRRLQLSAEQNQVTGFILRNNLKKLDASACVSRWKITSLPSESIDDLPGTGFPKWKAELLRIRNGKPGTWDIEWRNGHFVISDYYSSLQTYSEKRIAKAG